MKKYLFLLLLVTSLLTSDTSLGSNDPRALTALIEKHRESLSSFTSNIPTDITFLSVDISGNHIENQHQQDTPELKLMHAISNNDLEQVKKCLDEGADVNYFYGCNPMLYWAANIEQDPKILLLLLQNKKININIKNKLGETVLDNLLNFGWHWFDTPQKVQRAIDIINVLVAHGFDINTALKNTVSKGCCILDYVRQYNFDQRIIDLLEELSNKKKEAEEAKEYENSCSICFEPCQKSEVTLPCKHVFHQTCIDPWLAQNPTCPNCRNQALPQDQA